MAVVLGQVEEAGGACWRRFGDRRLQEGQLLSQALEAFPDVICNAGWLSIKDVHHVELSPEAEFTVLVEQFLPPVGAHLVELQGHAAHLHHIVHPYTLDKLHFHSADIEVPAHVE